jgi:hypothetical protein
MQKNAIGAFGVNKGNQLLMGVAVWFLINKLQSFGFETVQFGLDIIDFQ